MSRDLPCTLHTRFLFSPVHSLSLVGPSLDENLDFFAGVSDYGLPFPDLPLTRSYFLPRPFLVSCTAEHAQGTFTLVARPF